MRITKICGKAIAGATFEHALFPVTLLCGDNSQGKTTRLNCLTLTLADYIPGMSAKPTDIFEELATGSLMQCGIETDDKRTILRNWEQIRGSVKHTSWFNGFPDDFVIDPVAIDPNEYLGLSGPARTRFLFARSKSCPSIEKLTATITANIKNIKVEENTPDTEATINELVKWASTFISEDWPVGTELPPQEWLSALYAAVKEKVKLAKDNVDRQVKALQALTQNQSASPAPADAEQRRDEAQKELDAANAEVARLKQVGVGISEQLAEAKRMAGTAVDETIVRQQIFAQQETVTAAKLIPPPGERPVAKQMPGPRPTDAEARRLLGIAAQNRNGASIELNAITAEMKRLEQAVEDAKVQTTCPTCGHDITEKQKQVVAGLRKQLKEATGKHVSLTSVHAITTGKESDAIFMLGEATAAIEQWDKDKAALDTANTESSAKWCIQNHCYTNAQTRINAATAEIQRLESTIASNAAAREGAAKVPALETAIAQARKDYTEAETVTKHKRAALASCETDYKNLTRERGAAADRATAQVEAAKYRAEHSVLKKFIELLDELQVKLTEQVIGPILETCNRLCGGILKAPLSMRDGEIGMQINGKLVRKTMGGAEKLITYCAISLALATDAPLKLAIIDEVGRLDKKRKKLLVKNIISLYQSGEIDQCVLCEPDSSDYAEFVKEYPSVFGIIQL